MIVVLKQMQINWVSEQMTQKSQKKTHKFVSNLRKFIGCLGVRNGGKSNGEEARVGLDGAGKPAGKDEHVRRRQGRAPLDTPPRGL